MHGLVNWQPPTARPAYCSDMCSTAGERLARLGEAIDELAEDFLAPHSARPDATMQDRLARIWAMIAELDPELARRLPGYHPAAGGSAGAGPAAAE